jgi:transcriptional regulator GlxA family with amidase domain
VLIAYVDMESALGRVLSQRIDRDIFIVPPREAAHWRSILDVAAAPGEPRVERWLMYFLLQDGPAVKVHPGVGRVLRHLRASLGAADEDFSLSRLAHLARLSQSRFMHVFTQSTHVPLRPYVLWLRLQRACGVLMSGVSTTEAAHRAGFADGAHMTRTFRRMLGTTLREMIARKDEARGISLDLK